MKAHLLTIGDELLIGQTVNTNAAWLGEQLSLAGVDVRRSATMSDEADVIKAELDHAYEEATLVVTTGGLGPTHDDITKQAVADFFGKGMRRDETLLERVKAYYRKRERSMPDEVAALADLPEGFDLLENPVGTAAGLWYQDEQEGRERIVVVLPGVPQEMKSIFESAVLPRLEARNDLKDVVHRTLLTTGIGESNLQEQIGDLSDVLSGTLKLAYLPSTSGVRLRLTAYHPDPDAAEDKLDRLENVLRDRVGRYIFGTGTETLEEVLGRLLTERGLTVATAESCTGGFVVHRLTNVSGSSAYVVGSVVSYSDDVKTGQLGVDADVLAEHGAVSEPVARQMAEGVRRALGTDIGVSTTGIAGPTGGTDDKPVGTIWLAYADADGTYARRLQFTHDRMLNKELFSTSALELIRRQVLRKEREEAA